MPGRIVHGLDGIIGFRMLMIAAGYKDGNDAGTLRSDPMFKLAMPLQRGASKRAKGAKIPKKRKQPASAAELAGVPAVAGHEDRLARLARTVEAVRAGEHASPRTAKLLGGGVPKRAQKLMKEAAETAIDAVRDERTGFVNESADLLYNLVLLWSALGVAPPATLI